MYRIEFDDKELEAVVPQLASRLDDLETLLINAGQNKNVDRVIELSKFIETIRGFNNKMLMAKKI